MQSFSDIPPRHVKLECISTVSEAVKMDNVVSATNIGCIYKYSLDLTAEPKLYL